MASDERQWLRWAPWGITTLRVVMERRMRYDKE